MDLDQIEQLIAARRKVGSGATARQLREAAGMTQADIAEKIGVTPSAMSRLEAGTRKPRPETLLRWASTLNEIERRLQRATRRSPAMSRIDAA